MVIDPHAHIVSEEFIKDVKAGRFGPALSIEQGKKWEILVTKSTGTGQGHGSRGPLPKELHVLDMRLKDMDSMGVDRQILSVFPGCLCYRMETGPYKEVAAALNDSLAEIAGKMPERFSCMATVPLQDGEAAAEELERAVKLGHIGVEIASNIAGKNLDERSLDVFWDKVVTLDVPVFIHPTDVLGVHDRLKDYYLNNFIGNPLDTTIAAACLIFGGVMDRFPTLKILLSHLGGFTPWIRGRWEHGYGEREEPKVNGAKNPEAHIGRFYYDTIIHNADCFEFAFKTIGADHILYGTDYPFDMGYLGPAREIPGISGLSETDQEKVFSGNVKAIYKL